MTYKTPYPEEHRIALPLPPSSTASNAEEMDVYARFMRHLRHVPNNRMEIKILSAIQFTADMLDYGDEVIARMLVDMGLRGPRMAFPAAFLRHVDQSFMRHNIEYGGPSKAMQELRTHWDEIGEPRLVNFTGEYTVVDGVAWLHA